MISGPGGSSPCKYISTNSNRNMGRVHVEIFLYMREYNVQFIQSVIILEAGKIMNST